MNHHGRKKQLINIVYKDMKNSILCYCKTVNSETISIDIFIITRQMNNLGRKKQLIYLVYNDVTNLKSVSSYCKRFWFESSEEKSRQYCFISPSNNHLLTNKQLLGSAVELLFCFEVLHMHQLCIQIEILLTFT